MPQGILPGDLGIDATWYGVFVNTIGFIIGFAVGIINGFLGNWIWTRYELTKRNPYVKINKEEDGATFQGFLNRENKKEVIEMLDSIEVKKPRNAKP